MSESREAFDLFHPACRRNLKGALRYGKKWRSLWFWRMVVSDTVNRVCSRPAN